MHPYNFGTSGDILVKLFPADVLRYRGDNFWKALPLKFGRAKKRPNFGAIFDNFRL